MKLVADVLEEDRHATCEELSRDTGAKTLQEKAKNRPQLLVAGPLVLHDNARPHIADIVTKITSQLWGGKCYLMHPTVHT